MPRHYYSEKRDATAIKNNFAILRAAMDVFSERGYHGANMEEIARRANLSKGAVYTHFKNKRDLFLSVVEWGEHQLNQTLHETRKRYSDARDILESSIRAYLKFHEKRKSFFRVLIQEKYNFHDQIKQKVTKSFRQNLEELETDIRNGIKQGCIRDIDPHVGAVIVSGIANGLYFDWVQSESKEQMHNLMQKATDILENGFFVQKEKHK